MSHQHKELLHYRIHRIELKPGIKANIQQQERVNLIFKLIHSLPPGDVGDRLNQMDQQKHAEKAKSVQNVYSAITDLPSCNAIKIAQPNNNNNNKHNQQHEIDMIVELNPITYPITNIRLKIEPSQTAINDFFEQMKKRFSLQTLEMVYQWRMRNRCIAIHGQLSKQEIIESYNLQLGQIYDYYKNNFIS